MAEPPSEFEYLIDELHNRLVESKFDSNSRRFMPEGALEQCITKDWILAALEIDEPEPSDDFLVQFIQQKAMKLFATCVSCKLEKTSQLRTAMEQFMKKGINDDDLPIVEIPTSTGADTRKKYVLNHPFTIIENSFTAIKGTSKKRTKKIWDLSTIDTFCENQWMFLVPVFSTKPDIEPGHYGLAENTILPFTASLEERNEGSFGKVSKYQIHPNHIKDPAHPDEPVPLVLAVKEVLPREDIHRQKVMTHWEAEIKALRKMNGLNQDHIVRFVTAFRRCNGDTKDHYLIFEWADNGNLDDLLRREEHPVLDADLVRDSIQQFYGLACALSAAHYIDENTSYRHGDLKAANILRFKHANSIIGKLKIGDWGEAKEHGKPTEFRFSPTTAAYGTRRYEPPEVATGVKPRWLDQTTERRSRLYDIWAMGCITLEFMIWLLYGLEGLERFEKQFHKDSPSFYQMDPHSPDKAKIHPVVKKCMEDMTNDPRCGKEAALGRLLEIVSTGLLVVKLPQRTGTMRQVLKKGPASPTNIEPATPSAPRVLVSSVDSVEEPGLANTPAVSEEQRYVPAPVVREVPGPERFLASDFMTRMEDILSEEDPPDEFWLPTSLPTALPSSLSSPSKDETDRTFGSLSLLSAGAADRAVLTARRKDKARNINDEKEHPSLDDDWARSTDSALAIKVFAGINPPPDTAAPTKLCSQCVAFRAGIWTPGFDMTYYTSTIKQQAASRDCDLCGLFWKTCQRYEVEEETNVQISRVGSFLKIGDVSSPVLSIFRSRDLKTSIASDMPIGFRELPTPGSETHFRIVKEWLNICDTDKHHAVCRSKKHSTTDGTTRSMPTRLIDVGTSGSTTVRLHKTAENETGDWVALSHQWGTGRHYSTTRENLDNHMEGLPFESLPATFRDAVTVTRAIGLKYLWIDSLCIIQGDNGDFKEESGRMEEVYSGAYCVIAASRAAGHYSGFLRPTLPRDVVTLNRVNEAPFYICQMIDDFKSHVLDGGLNSRGWVLQEHALARRTIFFTEYQTYWECGQGVRCETMTTMSNNKAALLGDPNFPEILIDASQGERILRYEKLYEDYTRLGLSNRFDRPMAIDGLQCRLLRVMGARGGFGVFYDTRYPGLLRRSLLWRRGDDMHEKPLSRIQFPVNWVIANVPSWSWMAYTGSIKYLDLQFDGFDWVHIESPWSGSSLPTTRTEGPASGLTLHVKAREYNFKATANEPEAAVQPGGRLYFDDPSRVATTETLCVVLGIEKGPDPSTGREKPSSDKMNYLILVSASEKSGVGPSSKIYERVGAGYLPGRCIGATSSNIAIQ